MNKQQLRLMFGMIISWSVGFLGADRIYDGQVGLGVLKLLTLGGIGVWWLVDALIWTYDFGQSLGNKKD